MSSPGLAADELQALDDGIERALITGDETGLRLLGYGEISCVVAWESAAGALACKRLPPFSGPEHFARYQACVEAYLARLRQAGVTPVATGVQGCAGAAGRITAYCVQPMIAGDALLPKVLARCGEDEAVALFARLLALVRGCAGDRLGIDGQLSNWVLVAGELQYLDVSTPLMRDEGGRELLDTNLFLASLPWLLRGLVRRFMLGSILDKYYDARGVVVDLLGNLFKEGLERLVAPLCAVANEQLAPAIGERELRAYYRSDARMWALLQRLRRIDRFWQRCVRRRTYPFLLPRRIERHV